MSTSALLKPEPESAVGKQSLKVCVYVFFPAGGIGRYTHEWLRALGEMPGVTAEMVCTPDFQWKEAPEYTAWDGLRSISHPVPVLRRMRFVQGQFINPLRCIRHAEAVEADIIHLANINHLSFPFWRNALSRVRARVTVSVHDVLRQKAILNRAWEDRQLQAFYRYADALFVHSAYQANELVEFASVDRERIHVVPHGPYPHGASVETRAMLRERYGVPADQQVGLFFGQLRDEKNLDQLIQALALSTCRPHLVVAGTGGGRHRDVDYYRTLAMQLGVADAITFIPRYIPEEEVSDLFTMADWVALPYSNTFTSQSGVLNVAAHYERPVLVSSAPVLQETTRKSDIGVVCGGDTAPAIAKGIDELCGRVRDGYQHPFATYRDQFSWGENARRTVDVYRRLVAGLR